MVRRSRIISTLNSFVSSDNMITFHSGELAKNSTAPLTWNQIFGVAFKRPSRMLNAALGEIIGYDPPDLAPGSKPLTYLNAGKDGRPKDQFAILDISSIPPGQFLPKPGSREDKLSQNSYLAHLVSVYGSRQGKGPGNLAIVVYTVKSSDFIQEVAVTYWIRESTNGEWKIAGYHGTD